MLLTPISHLPNAKRKRHHSKGDSDISDGTRAKRLPPNAWDQLPKVWLSDYALEEQRRRYLLADTTPAPSSSSPSASSPSIFSTNASSTSTTAALGTLAQYARHGGPDLTDIRGYHKCTSSYTSLTTMPSHTPTGSQQDENPMSSGQSSGPYDSNFQSRLTRFNFFPPDFDCDMGAGTCLSEPVNKDAILQQLKIPRPDLSLDSFTADDYKEWKRTFVQARTEGTIMRESFPALTGGMKIPSDGDLLWNNLDPLIEGVELSQAKPDFFDGTNPLDLQVSVLDLLGNYIVPSKEGQAPCLPNFTVEVKGPRGTYDVLIRQALYDSALAERAINCVLAYVDQDVDPPNFARTLSCTFIEGHLRLYSVHRTKKPTSNERPYVPHIHVHLVESFDLKLRREVWLQGVTAFRNARDMAKQWRDELVVKANQKALKPQHNRLKAGNVADSFGSNESGGTNGTNSTDELSPDYGKRQKMS
ncbi:uncharacterized protein KY384_004674 [Bacidia gigantensis]|uniref:uncharacterized protein n=1 Tax=Bacidia gigantensis TaxID=2732470 RepID=UPI001D03BB9D|nr:uncharacterized protein KY384_004674 [Bacidia gigantensis]KAG8530636.1 hypothetical protein KY384_004674 [Bacidia gigantensis]